jgi:hypothetical protein
MQGRPLSTLSTALGDADADAAWHAALLQLGITTRP